MGGTYALLAGRSGERDLLDLAQAAPSYPPALEVVEHVVIRLPNGNLQVPQTAVHTGDGRLIGDVYVEIGPQDTEYARRPNRGAHPRRGRGAQGPAWRGRRRAPA